jgi:predicted O-linked N-acetylglucosamine transferase (SPINDLY family)
LRAFDEFHDVRSIDSVDVAKLVRDTHVDILLDLSGYTNFGRPEILAYRPAPIQVSYIGYPGTLGTEFYDYVIADPVVLPFTQQPFYSENIVHLPETYLPGDSKRMVCQQTPSKKDMALPESGFVFCCFNANYKITGQVFEIWMRLLRDMSGSVLWLYRSNAVAETNLRKAAVEHGIDSARLVFAGRVSRQDHLSRHRLADLFLDTLPVNAHTTASDALWMGLPMITCAGECFAGRVAASLLHAAGLSELVTHTLEEYEALALRLARDELLLAQYRKRLTQNQLSYPFFDTDRYRWHLESAYTTMWELWQSGERPRSFAVEPRSRSPA